jgi:2-succinyl-6-hydroxy-2,4-cyclohexadiene-1-carboxylate synthase
MSITAEIASTHWFFEDTLEAKQGTLVLLHGFTGCSDFWTEITDDLRTDFRCIVPDLPGHGRTELRDNVEDYRLSAVAQSLAELLDHLGVRKTAVWGYSMGGRLALQFAAAYPQRVSRLIVESASPGIADPEERRERRESDEKLADEIEEIGVAAFIERWEKQPVFKWRRDLPEDKRERSRVLRLANSARGLALSLRGMGAGAQDPLQDKLPNFPMPTLIVAGEHDEKYCTVGRDTAATIPNSLFRIVPAAGHRVSWERPNTCLRIVRPFLFGQTPPELFVSEDEDVSKPVQ